MFTCTKRKQIFSPADNLALKNKVNYHRMSKNKALQLSHTQSVGESERAGVHVCVFCLSFSWRLIGGGCQSGGDMLNSAQQADTKTASDKVGLSAYFTPRQ